MHDDGSAHPKAGPYASQRADLAYIAKEYQALEALADGDPEMLTYLAKRGQILDKAADRDKARKDAFAAMQDDGSASYEISLARYVLEELRYDGYVSERVFQTFFAGLDALTQQGEIACTTASNDEESDSNGSPWHFGRRDVRGSSNSRSRSR